MKKTFILLTSIIWWNISFSQDITPHVLSTAGNTYQGNSIQINWTLGELSIETTSNTNNQLTQGFHQPYYIITSTNNLSKEVGIINVFPNPTQDWLNAKLTFNQIRHVEMFLFDLGGNLIFSKKYFGDAFTINTSIQELPVGNYFLNFIIDNEEFQQTFKIQKIK